MLGETRSGTRSTASRGQTTSRIEPRGPQSRLGKTYRACSSPDRAFGSGPKGSRFDSCQAHQNSDSKRPRCPTAPADDLHFGWYAGNRQADLVTKLGGVASNGRVPRAEAFSVRRLT